MSQLVSNRNATEIGVALEGSLRSSELLREDFTRVRNASVALCEPLEIEDYVVQSMPDCSPTKWHLAHTSWFFETFVLKQFMRKYAPLNAGYDYLFNSYYNLIGERWARPQRGVLSRPTVGEVFEYRAFVDKKIEELLSTASESELREIAPLIILGLNHEQQHQELLLTDIKHVFAQNPLHPVYAEQSSQGSFERATATIDPTDWVDFDESLYEVGHAGSEFAFDNELPRHRIYLDDFKLSRKLVTNGEYVRFILDGGYTRPELWLSDGWNEVQTNSWNAPLYWRQVGEEWWHFTLSGFRIVDMDEPVTHVSYYEASAYAEWAGARLPREEEWEIASESVEMQGSFVESKHFHPTTAPWQLGRQSSEPLSQMFGEVWQWTDSSYSPYPGFKAPEGALGEYNGKFMINQMVLRGGSCATPCSHIRRTYRNFFPPSARWQFSGIRLAQGAMAKGQIDQQVKD